MMNLKILPSEKQKKKELKRRQHTGRINKVQRRNNDRDNI